MESYYEILGVNKNSSSDEIKRAYHNLALKYHPDLNPNDSNAEIMFRKINQAYSVLSNEYRKAQYDSMQSHASKANSTDNYTNEQALRQFMSTMYAYAADMTLQNIGVEEIASFLESKGCPHSIAIEIAQSNEVYKKNTVRKAAGKLFVKAAISLIAGISLTAISYGIGARVFFIFYGLILYGVWNIVRAIYYSATGLAPKADNHTTYRWENASSKEERQGKSYETLHNSRVWQENNAETPLHNDSSEADNTKQSHKHRVITFALVFVGLVFIVYLANIPRSSQAQNPSSVTVRIDEDLNIRSGPGSQYDVIAVYSKGARATVIGTYNNWYKVSFKLNSKSYIGWINREYTSR